MLKARVINPRKIITFVVFKYITEQQKDLIRKEIFVKTIKSDCKFVNELAKYFNFTTLLTNPQIPEDTWIYNYLTTETRKSDTLAPLKQDEFIKFAGDMPKKGLLLKYSNFMRKNYSQ